MRTLLTALTLVASLLATTAGCSSDDTGPATPTGTGTAGAAGAAGASGAGGAAGGGGQGGEAGGAGMPMGPLTVHPVNPRYFADPSGRPLYVASTYGGNTLQDQGDVGTFAWSPYVELLAEHDLNLAKYVIRDRCRNNGAISPTLYRRTGPGQAVDGGLKFDLTQLDPDVVTALRTRTADLESRGIYVVVMLFNRFDVMSGAGNWDASAFHGDNNINGIDGDTNGDGEGKEVQTLPLAADVEALEIARIHAIVDAVGEFDNVIYEACNETYGDTAWQQWVTDQIRSYEATKPKQHLVGQTATWPDGSNAALLASSADWISPERDDGGSGNYEDDPPDQDGTKIVIVDSDHVTAGETCTPEQVWKYFTTGAHPMCYEGWDINRAATHDAMRDTRSYSQRLDLSRVLPDGSRSSTGYCLADPGSAYLVYQPAGGAFTVDVDAGTYSHEWFDTAAGTIAEQGTTTAPGGDLDFTPPFAGPAVLYLHGS